MGGGGRGGIHGPVNNLHRHLGQEGKLRSPGVSRRPPWAMTWYEGHWRAQAQRWLYSQAANATGVPQPGSQRRT